MALFLAAVLFVLSFLAGMMGRLTHPFLNIATWRGLTAHSSPHQRSTKEPTDDTHIREETSRLPHFNAPSMQSEEQAFRQAYPAFESTSILDQLGPRCTPAWMNWNTRT